MHYLPSPITAIQVLHFLLFKVFPCLSIPFARLASNTAILPSCLCNTVCLVSLCSATATFMACLCKAMAEPILWHPFPATSGMRVPCSTSLAQNASMLPCLGVKLNSCLGTQTQPLWAVYLSLHVQRISRTGDVPNWSLKICSIRGSAVTTSKQP